MYRAMPHICHSLSFPLILCAAHRRLAHIKMLALVIYNKYYRNQYVVCH